MKPIRITLSRRKGWRMPPNTVRVCRPSKYGNPHSVGYCRLCGGDHTREEAIADFARMLDENRPDLSELRGKNLACFCKQDEACHADILLALANPE